MALPIGIQRSNFLSATVANDGVLHSIALKGGFQEHIKISATLCDVCAFLTGS